MEYVLKLQKCCDVVDKKYRHHYYLYYHSQLLYHGFRCRYGVPLCPVILQKKYVVVAPHVAEFRQIIDDDYCYCHEMENDYCYCYCYYCYYCYYYYYYYYYYYDYYY